MHDVKSIIEKRLEPIKYSEFRQTYADIIEHFESSLTKVGVKLIDIADNLCYDDRCEVLTPSGYPVFTDFNHWGTLYSRYWASSVDHLVDF